MKVRTQSVSEKYRFFFVVVVVVDLLIPFEKVFPGNI